MGWKEASESEGRAPKLPYGYNHLTVVKCVRSKRDGSELRSSKGGPFLMVVYENDDGAEGVVNYFLTEKAQWKLAKDLSRLGISMDNLDAEGVTPDFFLDVEFANKMLKGCTSWANVSAGSSGYSDIELVHDEDVPPKYLHGTGQLADEMDAAREQEQAKEAQHEDEQPPTTDEVPSDDPDDDNLPF